MRKALGLTASHPASNGPRNPVEIVSRASRDRQRNYLGHLIAVHVSNRTIYSAETRSGALEDQENFGSYVYLALPPVYRAHRRLKNVGAGHEFSLYQRAADLLRLLDRPACYEDDDLIYHRCLYSCGSSYRDYLILASRVTRYNTRA